MFTYNLTVDTFASKRKSFLSDNGFVFQKRDIINDPTAMEELVAIGVLTTPVTVIDGEVIVGFDRGRLDRALSD